MTERPCKDQVGTWAGVARHRRAERAWRAVDRGAVVQWGEIALEACPLCTSANRAHAREQYERSPRGQKAAARRAAKVSTAAS